MWNNRFRTVLIFGILAVVFALANPETPTQAADLLHRYPVIPAITGRVAYKMALLQRLGKKFNNRKDIFSKIGDSITQWGYFLTPISVGGLRLGSYTQLQGVVSFYSQEVARTNFSFANESLAAHGGWLSGDLLNPGKAFPGCGAGETPLDCEYRITRPAVALIMIGTNDLPFGNVAAYQANLDRILTITEAHGVIPVVSTIPGRKDAANQFVEAFNNAVIQVASAHSAPIWNYWLAMEALPDKGISTDTVHPSIPSDGNTAIFDAAHLSYGFTMRNLTALQTLNAIRAYLR